MKKINIIKESREFTEIINNKNSKRNKYYSIYYVKKNNEYIRFGISIPKKTGTAVTRNKIKRQIKNIIDLNKKEINNNYNYVIIVKKEIVKLNYQEKEKELMFLFNLIK